MATALITGASSGLGLEYAKLFAADKHDLVLVARRRDRLDALAAELRGDHGIAVHVVPVDLSQPDATAQIIDALEKAGVTIDFLVNNAGVGMTGRFSESETDKALSMLQINVVALTTLTRALLPPMLERGHGRVLNIGSTAGFQPGPFMAVYYASKAYVNSFTEALSYELHGTGVTATVSCPGPTETEFAKQSGVSRTRLFRAGRRRASVVAREAYRAMLAGKPIVVHGAPNRLLAFAQRFSPRWATRALAGALNQPSKANE